MKRSETIKGIISTIKNSASTSSDIEETKLAEEILNYLEAVGMKPECHCSYSEGAFYPMTVYDQWEPED